jgi:hypothetical protein
MSCLRSSNDDDDVEFLLLNGFFDDKNDRNDSGGGSSGGCFIATAAYGSPLEARVVTLKEFRDRWLLVNAVGKYLVRFYYKHSPPLASIIETRQWLKLMVRGVLTPLVAIVYQLNRLRAFQKNADQRRVSCNIANMSK